MKRKIILNDQGLSREANTGKCLTNAKVVSQPSDKDQVRLIEEVPGYLKISFKKK